MLSILDFGNVSKLTELCISRIDSKDDVSLIGKIKNLRKLTLGGFLEDSLQVSNLVKIVRQLHFLKQFSTFDHSISKVDELNIDNI